MRQAFDKSCFTGNSSAPKRSTAHCSSSSRSSSERRSGSISAPPSIPGRRMRNPSSPRRGSTRRTSPRSPPPGHDNRRTPLPGSRIPPRRKSALQRKSGSPPTADGRLRGKGRVGGDVLHPDLPDKGRHDQRRSMSTSWFEKSNFGTRCTSTTSRHHVRNVQSLKAPR